MVQIRTYQPSDEAAVVALWHRCGLTRPWNDPRKDIARKLGVQAELFFVAMDGSDVVGSVMAGYDGHRGWLYGLGVDPKHQRRGIGRALVEHVEQHLQALGCPKLNLQIRHDNIAATEFYARLGYTEDRVVSYGKRLEHDLPEERPSAPA